MAQLKSPIVYRSTSVFVSPPTDKVVSATLTKTGEWKYEVLLEFQYSRRHTATAFLNAKGGWKVEEKDGEAKLKEAKSYSIGAKIPPSLQEELEKLGVDFA